VVPETEFLAHCLQLRALVYATRAPEFDITTPEEMEYRDAC